MVCPVNDASATAMWPCTRTAGEGRKLPGGAGRAKKNYDIREQHTCEVMWPTRFGT